MKFQYRREERGIPLFGALLIVLILSVVLFGLDSLTNGLVRSYARTSASLAQSAAAGTLSQITGSGVLTTRRALSEEIAQLEEKITLQAEQAARFNALQAENEALRALAGIAAEEKGISARVLSSLRTSPYGTFIIGAGEESGVIVGALVLSPGGFLLGEVTDTDSYTATVETLFAPRRETDVIAGDVAFIAEGSGGGNARGEVSRGAALSVGENVTASLYGRVAGIIGSIESASSSATQTLFIRIPTNLDTLQFVFVVYE